MPEKDLLRMAGDIEMFACLDQAALSDVVQQCNWTSVSKGQHIVTHRDNTTEVYFIARGAVRVTNFSLAGHEISFEDLGDGKMFGELSAIDGQPRAATVIAQTECLIGSLSAQKFLRLTHEYPGIAEAVLKRLADMVRALCNRLFERRALTGNPRVSAELLRLSVKRPDGTAVIKDPPTHQEIANRVGSHREAVTRHINKLIKKGYLKKDGRDYIILDMDALTSLIPELTSGPDESDASDDPKSAG